VNLQNIFLKEFQLNTEVLSTLYVYENGKIYQKSTGALKLVTYLKKRFFILKICWISPRFIRDLVYDFIAKNRKRFFNVKCDLVEIDKGRFLELEE
jgi:predicted DCC family thiol-disulfide oxidoreductase YuxK